MENAQTSEMRFLRSLLGTSPRVEIVGKCYNKGIKNTKIGGRDIRT
jgi:tRNA pseudouridine-54 N-methylase